MLHIPYMECLGLQGQSQADFLQNQNHCKFNVLSFYKDYKAFTSR